MRLGQPNLIYTLWLVVGLLIFYIWAFRARKRTLERFAQRGLLEGLASSVDMRKKRLKAMLVVASSLFLFLALMRPQWGFNWQELKRRGLDILIAIDTSKSMLTQDVKPNRLERSKLAVRDLIKRLKGDRIGLIAFSGSAFLQCPLTVDYNGFSLALDSLDTETIPKPGTSISSAIREAIKGYEGGGKKYKVLVIITDGEDHEGDPLRLAEEAKQEGIRIFCIGIGTKEGELIPVRDESGATAYLKDKSGNVVKSRLNEDLLQRIALTTDGSYVRASATEFGLDLIYQERLIKMERRELEEKMVKRYNERFQIPLGLALILLLIEPLIGEKKR